MKTLPIDTAASWLGTLSTIQDGDPASEASMDLVVDSIGDRLGYLKTQADGSVNIAGTQTITGTKTFSSTLNASGAVDCARVLVSDFVSFDPGAIGVLHRTVIGPDAAYSIQFGYDEVRVPAITAARIYTLPSPSQDAKINVVRIRSSDAHSVTLNNELGVTMGVISSNQAGFLTVVSQSGVWKLSAWGGGVTSLSTTV